jgi:hypothetical protein
MLLNNVGLCLQKKNDENALFYYYKSLKIRDINDDNGLLDTYYNLSEYYKKKIDIAKSINARD